MSCCGRENCSTSIVGLGYDGSMACAFVNQRQIRLLRTKRQEDTCSIEVFLGSLPIDIDGTDRTSGFPVRTPWPTALLGPQTAFLPFSPQTAFPSSLLKWRRRRKPESREQPDQSAGGAAEKGVCSISCRSSPGTAM